MVQLGCDAFTAMCMLYARPHMYSGRGAAVLFHGSAVHAGLRAIKDGAEAAPVWKVSLFWKRPSVQPKVPSAQAAELPH